MRMRRKRTGAFSSPKPLGFLSFFKMAAGNLKFWSRRDISTCSCSERSYRHVHCPCPNCKGRATDKNKELRHWREASILHDHRETQLDIADGTCTQGTSNQSYDSESEGIEVDFLESRFSEGEQDMEVESVAGSDIEADLLQQEFHEADEQHKDGGAVLNMTNPMRKLVVTAVLDALKIKRDSGVSIGTFQDILQYAKGLLMSSIDDKNIDRDILSTLWPKTWNDVQSLLKEEGFEDAKQFFICICRQEKMVDQDSGVSKYSYSGKYSIVENKEDLCTHCGNKCYLTYYYLGLHSKVKNWFRNKSLCEKMLSHWKERDHWLRKDESWSVKKEIWDGQRWLDLQWFWDPNKTWPLPTICPSCGIPVSADHVSTSADEANGLKTVECPECLDTFQHKMKFATGNPLNLALIGHWDGWQPFGSSLRSCGSIEVSIANLKKEDRNHVDEVYVVGFVPSYVVPNIPEALDPFLHPLMNDICKGFIDGFEVNYHTDILIDGYEPSNVEKVRVLLLCWSGDHPGLCEVGKLLNQGKCGCRRCKLVGQHLRDSTNRHMYYGENRFHYRFPWEPRDIATSLTALFDIENETRVSVRKRTSSELGFTGMSILHKYLYPLYGFDICKHLVYDVYHTICLNVVKNQAERLLDLELIDKRFFDKQIQTFPWPKELKNGRVPRPIGKLKGLGQWKAEGLQKFAFPMMDCILAGQLTNPKELEIQSLVSRLTEIHFYTGRNGWTDNLIDQHRKLSWRLNILVEEVQGLEMCTISLHNLTHIHEDVITMSAPDNYWCAVKGYVKRSSNCKGIEAMFATAEAQREFLKPSEETDVYVGKINKEVVKEYVFSVMFSSFFNNIFASLSPWEKCPP